jgi:hypothetical protein
VYPKTSLKPKLQQGEHCIVPGSVLDLRNSHPRHLNSSKYGWLDAIALNQGLVR